MFSIKVADMKHTPGSIKQLEIKTKLYGKVGTFDVVTANRIVNHLKHNDIPCRLDGQGQVFVNDEDLDVVTLQLKQLRILS